MPRKSRGNDLNFLTYYQIIIDVVFFVTILLLLHRLSGKIAKRRPAVDTSMMDEVKDVMTESQTVTHQFVEAIEKNVQALNRLSHQLDEKEKRLVILLAQADSAIKSMEAKKEKTEAIPQVEGYEGVVKMVQQGLSREEVSRRTGFSEGEVSLVMELVRVRKEKG